VNGPAGRKESITPGITLAVEETAELADFLRFQSKWAAATRDQLSYAPVQFMDDRLATTVSSHNWLPKSSQRRRGGHP
jgi:hypothetical protein